MFTSDKDLRKAVPRRGAQARPQRSTGTGTGTSGAGNSGTGTTSASTQQASASVGTGGSGGSAPASTAEGLVEEAKRQRELRAKQREQAGFAVQIQVRVSQ
jgi:hypothetical protein